VSSSPLVAVLRGLVAQTPQREESAGLKIELARLLLQRGETEEARGLLEPLAAGGRSGPGYADALELLVPLLQGADDALARSTVLAARAEMVQGSQRARLLHEAALAAQQAGDEARAARLARASVATEATQDALLLLAGLMRDASELAKAAASLTQAAQLARPEDRPRLLLEAAEAWEGAGDPAEAQELLDRVARLHPGTLGPGAWAARFLRLGAGAQALEHGYEPLFAHGAFAQALEIAEALEDTPRIRQSLWGLAQGPAGDEALARLSTLLLAEGTAAERVACAELARRAGDGSRGGAPPGNPPLASRRTPRTRTGCVPSSGSSAWASSTPCCRGAGAGGCEHPARAGGGAAETGKWSPGRGTRAGPAPPRDARARPAPPSCGRPFSSRRATTTASRMLPPRSRPGWTRRRTLSSGRACACRPEISPRHRVDGRGPGGLGTGGRGGSDVARRDRKLLALTSAEEARGSSSTSRSG
jgi:tetratricopeptide (TPR) repeat protein